MRRTLVAVVIAGLGLVAAVPAWATFPGTNGRIAYASQPAGPFVVDTILPSGEGKMQLGPGLSPSWSADGQRIVFTRGVGNPVQGEIYSMTAQGSDVRRLTHTRFDDGRPSYSPDGTRILFGEIRQPTEWVMKMRSGGSGLKPLVQGGNAAWSPSGKQIAYNSATKGGIWVMRPDGSHRHRIIKRGALWGGYSPDGSKLTFSRCGDSRCRTFVAHSDGTNIRRLPCPPNYFDGAPTYSPDGRRLLGERSDNAIITLPTRSCSPMVVATGASEGTTPSWQPLVVP